jgi:two-component system chemotaxis sensor kinase CheA
MNKKNEEFQKRLLLTFRIEAEEHLKAMTSGLIEMEKDLSPELKTEIIETVFREAHSLKGAARSVSITEIETICQFLESVFARLKRSEIDLTSELFDTLHKVVDTLSEIIFPIDDGKAKDGKDRVLKIKKLLTEIEAGKPKGESLISDRKLQTEGTAAKSTIQNSKSEINTPFPENKAQVRQSPQAKEMLRISADKMVALLLQVEEIVSAKLAVNQHANDVGNILSMFDVWNKEWSKKYRSIRDFQRKQEKKNGAGEKNQSNSQSLIILEFLNWAYTRIKSIENKLVELKKQADHNRYSINTMVDNLLEDVKKILMLPFSTLIETLPKMVRDLSHEQGKDVELSINGEDIEIDRRILEEMRIPFMHLIRNSIDHGVEKPEERLHNNKQRAGRISIAVSRVEDNKVEIIFSDDGRGINVEKVKEVSMKQRIISPSEKENLSNQEALPLVFQSGVSTSAIITDISGRGLGLAIVKEKVEQLGGQVSIESRHNAGTSFKILLPVSIATFRGVLARVAEQELVIPTVSIEKVLRVKREEIGTVENRETISLWGATIPLVPLDSILELPTKKNESIFIYVVIVGSAEKLIGFVVDEVLNEQEVLVKNFGRQLSRVRNVVGATILGSGKVVPVLNVSDLIKSTVKYAEAPVKADTAQARDEKKKSILVVEDSITSRMLIKNILETSGYLVKTAFDGIDAITQLKTEEINLVVSDVDMPRMNGFDLTAKIRSDKKLSELPVVLITALDSSADREHGIDVGANAYIVKSDFNQSNLLEVVRRLV